MMKNNTTTHITILLLLLLTPTSESPRAVPPLPSTIPSTLQQCFWGLSVQSTTTGEELIGIRSHHLFTPASTLKVVTTASALSMLPPEQRIPTQLHTNGTLQGGTLKGDLIIIGAGDPHSAPATFGNRPLLFLKEATKALKERHSPHRGPDYSTHPSLRLPKPKAPLARLRYGQPLRCRSLRPQLPRQRLHHQPNRVRQKGLHQPSRAWATPYTTLPNNLTPHLRLPSSSPPFPTRWLLRHHRCLPSPRPQSTHQRCHTPPSPLPSTAVAPTPSAMA